MNDAVEIKLDKIIQLLSKLSGSETEPQRKKVTTAGKEKDADKKAKEPREIVQRGMPVRIEGYSTDVRKFWNDLFSKFFGAKKEAVVAEKKEEGSGFFVKLLKILGGIALGAVLIKFLLPFIKDKVLPFLTDMFKSVTGFITKYITPLLGPALEGIVEFLTETLPDAVGEFFTSTVEYFSNLWDEITENWHMVWKPKLLAFWNDTLVPFFEKIWKSIVDNWPKWKEKILKIWDGLVDFFKGLWESIRTNWYMEWEPKLRALWNDTLVPFFEKIWTTIKDTWEKDIKPALIEYWNKTLVPFFCSIWKTIKDTWEKDIKPALIKYWNDTLVPFFKSILDWVTEKWVNDWQPALLNVLTRIFTFGFTDFDGIKKGLLKMENMFYSVILDTISLLEKVAKKIVSIIPQFLQKKLGINQEGTKEETPVGQPKEPAPANDFISRPGQPTQRFDSTDDVLGYKSDGPINFISKEALALQKTSITQNTKIIELLACSNKLLTELGRNALQKPGTTTIVNAPKTTSLSYNTAPLQSSFRQSIA